MELAKSFTSSPNLYHSKAAATSRTHARTTIWIPGRGVLMPPTRTADTCAWARPSATRPAEPRSAAI